MSKTKGIIIAASAAVATELVGAACLMRCGGEEPADFVGWVGLVLAYPILVIAHYLDGLSTFVFVLLGFLQFFVIYAAVIFLWRYFRNGRTAG